MSTAGGLVERLRDGLLGPTVRACVASAALAAALYAWAMAGMFQRANPAVEDDSLRYHDLVIHLREHLAAGDVEPYFVTKLLPPAVLRLAFEIVRVQPDHDNTIRAFEIADVVMVFATALAWRLTGRRLGLRPQAVALGFTTLFVNYGVAKWCSFYPVLLDTWGLAFGAAAILFYVERRPVALAAVSLAAAFAWPAAGYLGAILLCFLPESSRASLHEPLPVRARWLGGALFACACLVAVRGAYAALLADPSTKATLQGALAPLSLALLVAYAFAVGYVVFENARSVVFSRVLRPERVAAVAVAAVELYVPRLVGDPRGFMIGPAPTARLVAETTASFALSYPLAPLVAATGFFGPGVLWMIARHRVAFRRAAGLGPGFAGFLFAGILFALNTEERRTITHLPALALVVALAGGDGLGWGAVAAYFGVSLVYSRAWLHLGGRIAWTDATLSPWSSSSSYWVHLAAATAVGVALIPIVLVASRRRPRDAGG